MVIKDKNSAIKVFLSDKVGISGGFVLVFIVLVFLFNSQFAAEEEVFNLNTYNHIKFDKLAELSRQRNPNCSIFDCFNVYRCGNHQNKIYIYIYPFIEYYSIDRKSNTFITKEFYLILKAIKNSPYYTTNPKEACLFVPSIDLLNQNLIDKSLVEKALASLNL